MNDPDDLLNFISDPRSLPKGLPLIAGLTGFIDSGSAAAQYTDYIRDQLEGDVVVECDVDRLLDYRARRPTIYFDQDHIAGYETPSLRIHLMRDDIGRQFYFLSGFEPDFEWEAFSRALLWFASSYEVSSLTWAHAIPMPAPHTRPIGVTVSGTRRDLVDAMSVWRPNTQAPANAMHLVEFHLGQAGIEVVGFVLLVPHYLADAEYPTAALVALQSITAATGLIFPTDRLREEGRSFDQKIDEQIESNEELAAMVHKLEETYDEYMEDKNIPSPLTRIDGSVPSAETIAAELEEFLAARRRRDADTD